MMLAEELVDLSSWLWVGVLAVSGLVVLAIYLTDRAVWGLLITAYVLLAVSGLIAFAELDILPDPFIAIYVLTAIALPFLYVFLRNRSNWWALIPSYVLFAVAIMIGLIEWNVLQGEFVAMYVLTAIALPFLMVFLNNRDNWWALIPCYVLLAIGAMIALIGLQVLGGLLIPSYVLLAIALPFFVVYARDSKQWWPLIPGGILAVIGISFLLATRAVQYVGAVLLIVAGIVVLVIQFARQKQ
jgi:hypothetical protein